MKSPGSEPPAPEPPWLDAWEAQADAWIGITHDDPMYEYINKPAFLELVPPPGALTLDIGCGEGRMARALRRAGHTIVGIDGSRSLLKAAGEHEEAIAVGIGDIHRLPVRGDVADLIVCFMVLMDVDDLAVAMSELARVLRSGGRLCMAVLHPIATSGLFVPGDEFGTFYMGEYLKPMRHVLDINRFDGKPFRLRIAHQPIEHYSRALEAAGFAIEAIREPKPSADDAARYPHLANWTRVPDFLQLRAVKLTA